MNLAITINAIPRSIRQDFTSLDFNLLEKILGLCVATARRSPTGAPYCFASQSWLGANLAVRRETISRHIGILQDLGFLIVVRRRKEAGRWMTNLMEPGPRHWQIVRQPGRAARAVVRWAAHVGARARSRLFFSNRVTQTSHIEKLKERREVKNPPDSGAPPRSPSPNSGGGTSDELAEAIERAKQASQRRQDRERSEREEPSTDQTPK